MKIIAETDDKILPNYLSHQGRAWLDLYDHAAQDGDAAKLMPGIYCLFSAVEMHLKAYIVLKDSTYAYPNNLKRLMHNFNRMYEKFATLAPQSLKKLVKAELDKYHLMTIDINNLKYDKSGTMWLIDQDLEKGEHTLRAPLDIIYDEVEAGAEKWIKDVYPRTSRMSLLLQGEWEEYPTREQTEEWLKFCPDCRPENIILSRQLSYPWCLDDQPYEFCAKCSMPFRADRSSMLG